MGTRPLAAAAVVTLAAGCGAAGPQRGSSSAGAASAPAALVRESRPIGRGPRFHPPARGPVIGNLPPGARGPPWSARRGLCRQSGRTRGGRDRDPSAPAPLRRTDQRGWLLRAPGHGGTDWRRAAQSGTAARPGRAVSLLGAAAVAPPAGRLCRRSLRTGGGVCQWRTMGGAAGRRPAQVPRRDRSGNRSSRAASRGLHVPARNLRA